MKISISTQEYEVIKDGTIIANEDDEIIFKFQDLTFRFKIVAINSGESKEFKDEFEISPDNKQITFPIKMSWDYLSTTFSKRVELATFEETNQKKRLYLAYMVSGLKGESARVYVFRYTWYSKIVEQL